MQRLSQDEMRLLFRFVEYPFISFHIGLGVVICLLRCAPCIQVYNQPGCSHLVCLVDVSTYTTRTGPVLCRFSHFNPARAPPQMTLRDTKRHV